MKIFKRKCNKPQLHEMIGAYELGLLSKEDKEEFEIHLLNCDVCFNDLRDMAPMIKEIKESPNLFLSKVINYETSKMNTNPVYKRIGESINEIGDLILTGVSYIRMPRVVLQSVFFLGIMMIGYLLGQITYTETFPDTVNRYERQIAEHFGDQSIIFWNKILAEGAIIVVGRPPLVFTGPDSKEERADFDERYSFYIDPKGQSPDIIENFSRQFSDFKPNKDYYMIPTPGYVGAGDAFIRAEILSFLKTLRPVGTDPENFSQKFSFKYADQIIQRDDKLKRKFNTYAYKPDSLLLKENLILIGGGAANDVTSFLWWEKKFEPLSACDNMCGILYQGDTLKYQIDRSGNGMDYGVVQVFNNPFNKNKKIIVFSGLETTGTKATFQITSYKILDNELFKITKKLNNYTEAIIKTEVKNNETVTETIQVLEVKTKTNLYGSNQ